ncbi:MAG: dethiobiotin synthase, partial [Planctomycetota bacterium]
MGLLLHVVGTDTDAGKTVVTAGLVRALRERGHDVGVVKPFATGTALDAPESDTAILAAASGDAPEALCEWHAPEPLAPMVAAERAGKPLDVNAIAAAVRERAVDRPLLLIEGIGGVQTPLASGVSYLDFVAGLGGAVVVVGRAGLGTLNHVRLTVDACRHAGLAVLGVVLTHTDPGDDSAAVATNRDALAATLPVPVWESIPHLGAEAATPPAAPFAAHAAAVAAALLADGEPEGTVPSHELVTRVRYGETDQMGVVYHANYLRYFDMGRTELMRARGMPYNELERAGFSLAVTEAQCRYIAP